MADNDDLAAKFRQQIDTLVRQRVTWPHWGTANAVLDIATEVFAELAGDLRNTPDTGQADEIKRRLRERHTETTDFIDKLRMERQELWAERDELKAKLKAATQAPVTPDTGQRPNRVQVMSEIQDGLRCAVCENPFVLGERSRFLRSEGCMIHDECPERLPVTLPRDWRQQIQDAWAEDYSCQAIQRLVESWLPVARAPAASEGTTIVFGPDDEVTICGARVEQLRLGWALCPLPAGHDGDHVPQAPAASEQPAPFDVAEFRRRFQTMEPLTEREWQDFDAAIAECRGKRPAASEQPTPSVRQVPPSLGASPAASEQPRVWKVGDLAPEWTARFRDKRGYEWIPEIRHGEPAWHLRDTGAVRLWSSIVDNYAPLTEIRPAASEQPEEGDECYACLVGVATGPESHSPSCPVKHVPMPEQDGQFGQEWSEYARACAEVRPAASEDTTARDELANTIAEATGLRGIVWADVSDVADEFVLADALLPLTATPDPAMSHNPEITDIEGRIFEVLAFHVPAQDTQRITNAILANLPSTDPAAPRSSGDTIEQAAEVGARALAEIDRYDYDSLPIDTTNRYRDQARTVLYAALGLLADVTDRRRIDELRTFVGDVLSEPRLWDEHVKALGKIALALDAPINDELRDELTDTEEH